MANGAKNAVNPFAKNRRSSLIVMLPQPGLVPTRRRKSRHGKLMSLPQSLGDGCSSDQSQSTRPDGSRPNVPDDLKISAAPQLPFRRGPFSTTVVPTVTWSTNAPPPVVLHCFDADNDITQRPRCEWLHLPSFRTSTRWPPPSCACEQATDRHPNARALRLPNSARLANATLQMSRLRRVPIHVRLGPRLMARLSPTRQELVNRS